jgi:hypothetical protein
MILFEGLLIAAAGITYISGVRGMVIAGGLVSVINFSVHETTDFWKWEGFLILGSAFGILVLIGLNYQARKVRAMSGLVGGIISLVLFGVFFTPLLALVSWALIIGTGLRPRQSPGTLFWGFMPSICRAVLGLGWIIFGNSFFPS